MKGQIELHRIMPIPLDPVLMLQLVVTAVIVATLPAGSRHGSTDDDLTAMTARPEPFLHSDGNTYVEHAGMAIDPELFQLITPRP